MKELTYAIKNYVWGDPTFLPQLVGVAVSDERWAEIWMGDHPGGPSSVNGEPLSEVIAKDPQSILGSGVAAEFGSLPFLFKLLAAAQPLSLQVHPSRTQAVIGFDREEAAGLPVDSSERNYQDPNHKPELICALTPFVAKCGFRSAEANLRLLEMLECEEIEPLAEILRTAKYEHVRLREAMAWILGLDPVEGAGIVAAVVEASTRVSNAQPDGEFAHAMAWSAVLDEHHPGDVGVVLALLLNHVELEPGEAIAFKAGNLHAYLHGAGVELMGNSDNVVRCGLTKKYVDLDGALNVVDTHPINVEVQRPDGADHLYESGVREFDLARHVVDGSLDVRVNTCEILVATDGDFTLTSGDEVLYLNQGAAVFVPASQPDIKVSGSGMLFRAMVGVKTLR